MRREKLLTGIERLALGAGMSLAALLLELVLKRRMRRRTGVPAAGDGASPPDRRVSRRGLRAPRRRSGAAAADRR